MKNKNVIHDKTKFVTYKRVCFLNPLLIIGIFSYYWTIFKGPIDHFSPVAEELKHDGEFDENNRN